MFSEHFQYTRCSVRLIYLEKLDWHWLNEAVQANVIRIWLLCLFFIPVSSASTSLLHRFPLHGGSGFYVVWFKSKRKNRKEKKTLLSPPPPTSFSCSFCKSPRISLDWLWLIMNPLPSWSLSPGGGGTLTGWAWVTWSLLELEKIWFQTNQRDGEWGRAHSPKKTQDTDTQRRRNRCREGKPHKYLLHRLRNKAKHTQFTVVKLNGNRCSKRDIWRTKVKSH